jgi:chromosome partitioning protein
VVPGSVKFREAFARGTPLIHYDRFGPGAEAYRAAAQGYLAGGQPAISAAPPVGNDDHLLKAS